jgi:hypothetical protein
MASASHGSIRIGMKRIELQSLTGQVSGKPTSFYLCAPDGERELVEVSHSGVYDGDTATLFWGDVGKPRVYWLAVYNHARDGLKFVDSVRNDLSGPWLLTG